MKRNEGKSVVSLVAAVVFALLAAGCVSVPSAESGDAAYGDSLVEVKP